MTEENMKGQELIDWIHEMKAEQANFVVQRNYSSDNHQETEEPYLKFAKHGLRVERDGKFVYDNRTVLL